MLEPFITLTVASYNFNISSCNCSVSFWLLNRILHWMKQLQVYTTLVKYYGCTKFHQQPIIKLYTASHAEQIFPSCEYVREIRENLHLGKITCYTLSIAQDSSSFKCLNTRMFTYTYHTHLYNWSTPSCYSSTATFNECYNDINAICKAGLLLLGYFP